jgi:hypothetical protein
MAMLGTYLGHNEPTLSEVIGILVIVTPMFAVVFSMSAWRDKQLLPMLAWGSATVAAFMLLTGQKDLFPQSDVGWVLWVSAIPVLGTIAMQIHANVSRPD